MPTIQAARTLPPEHPQRRELLAEAHVRPSVPLRAPQHLTHFTLCIDPDEHQREIAHLADLCRKFGAPPPAPHTGHVLVTAPAFRLRWEHHTEFSSYTIFANRTDGELFQVDGLDAVPAEWVANLPGCMLAACRLSLVHAPAAAGYPEWVHAYFDPQSLSGSRCAGGTATVWTDFKPQDDGFTRFLVLDNGLNPAQAGRLVQRLLEIETYRLMALLALPIVKRLMPEIASMENALGDLTERMSSSRDPVQEQDLLESLSALSAQVERIIARNKFRLDASAAYATLVWRRIDALREVRVEGASTIHEFMSRRLAPAMDTCEAIAGRLDRLSGRVSRAASLLRSRVDLALEAQNQDLLASMNRRTRLQLRLQSTVEGLSVVVLSYYTVSLIHDALRALAAAGWPVAVDRLTGLSIAVVVPVIAAGILVVHHRVKRADADSAR